MLDVLANLAIFSGRVSTAFSVDEAAQFSTVLGVATVLSSLFFGGAEAVSDHRKHLPTALFFRCAPGALIAVSGVMLVVQYLYIFPAFAWVPLLVVLQGLRGVGRASNYSLNRFFYEAATSLIELIIIIGLLMYGVSIVSAYLATRTVGVSMRLKSLVENRSAEISPRDFVGYSFSALTPALYFNLYYAFLPYYASSELIVKFRYIQSILVPISFLGSLLSRATILFHGKKEAVAVDGNKKNLIYKKIGYTLFPFALSFLYLYLLHKTIIPISLEDSLVIGIYTGSIFHRSQMYAQITIKKGAGTRGLVGLFGVVAIGLSIPPLGLFSEIQLIHLFGALCVVEIVLLTTCYFLLRDRREGV